MGLSSIAPPIHAASTAIAAAATTGALTKQIDAYIGQGRFASASWGIAVVSLDDGHALYAHHADRLMQPASTAKLFTAAVSLSTLGADYRLPTRLLLSGSLRNGRLDGRLILYGMGDPSLGTSASPNWAGDLAAKLATRGVQFVHGDLIADDRYFASPSFGSGWEAGDLQSWFAVPASALSVQENVVDLTITPGIAGARARLDFTPVDAALPVLGQITTTAVHTHNDINLYRAPGETELHAFGSIAAHTPPQHFKLALPDPALLAGQRLRQALANQGIHVTGKVRALHWPEDDAAVLAHSEVVGEVRSPPLLELLKQGLKRSQNLYLQNLLLSVGVHAQTTDTDSPPGFASSEDYGIRALRRLLGQIGVPAWASQIVEGTGLSRRDLATPDAVVRLLVYTAAQPYADALRDSLPDAGVDGTLAGRMRGTAASGNVQAKTGNMAYVHCLAGYVTTAAGDKLAFAIMLNNYLPPAGAPRASSDVDAIAIMLANFAGHD